MLKSYKIQHMCIIKYTESINHHIASSYTFVILPKYVKKADISCQTFRQKKQLQWGVTHNYILNSYTS